MPYHIDIEKMKPISLISILESHLKRNLKNQQFLSPQSKFFNMDFIARFCKCFRNLFHSRKSIIQFLSHVKNISLRLSSCRGGGW
eukprot:UN01708